MKALGHVMILASAGSGKTYALTNRFVRLLANGAAPERIVALTLPARRRENFLMKSCVSSPRPPVIQSRRKH